MSSDPLESVRNYLVYGLSLPERAIRSTSAVVGGAIRESANLLLPASFRDSRSYQILVQQTLDFMARDVGGAKTGGPGESVSGNAVEGYVAKKAASQFVELAGLAALHVSPLLMLAVVSDIAYGSTGFLRELSEELKRDGVIAADSTIDSTAQLLEAVGNATGRTAGAIDLPPLNVDGLQKAIRETADAVRKADPALLIPRHEIGRLWDEMRELAQRENTNLLQISGAMTLYTLNQVGAVARGALTAVRLTGSVLDRNILEHYRQAAELIGRDGLFRVASGSSGPYIEAVWNNFSAASPTVTARLLSGQLFADTWNAARGLFASGTRMAGDAELADPATAATLPAVPGDPPASRLGSLDGSP